MQAQTSTARSTLLALVEEHMTILIRQADAVQRHSKRARRTLSPTEAAVLAGGAPPVTTGSSSTQAASANAVQVRRRLHAADINLALHLQGSEKLYTSTTGSDPTVDPGAIVNLQDVLLSETAVPPPSEVALSRHWLAVQGETPAVPSNPYAPTATSSVSPALAASSGAAGGVQVEQLQASLLSEELQLYWTRVTLALQQQTSTAAVDAVLQSVATDAGLQELVPFFLRHLSVQLSPSTMATSDPRPWLRLARALLVNPNLHLELYLHQLLPTLLTCVVAKRVESVTTRREAAAVLHLVVSKFGNEYTTLPARVLRALCRTLETDDDSSYQSQYGGLVAIAMFGPAAIDAFLLPFILSHWSEWQEKTQRSDSKVPFQQRLDIAWCQQASLEALEVYFRHTTAAQAAARLGYDDLEDLMGGDVLAMLTSVGSNGSDGVVERNEYAECFV